MEATVLSVGRSVLDGAIGYAKSAFAEEVALQLGVRRDQVFITNELEMIKAFLESAHDEGADDKVVKVWVKQVRDVAYDVEDCLQEFAVRLNKQSWWRISRTLLDRRRVAKQMKELRANVEDVSQRNTSYSLIKGSGSKAATIADEFAIAGATMSGIEEARQLLEKAKVGLIQLIIKKDDDLRVIAVSGTGAGHLEETSVIRRAYEDPNIMKKFECRAWMGGLMCPFNLTEFLRSIIEQFHVNFLREARNNEIEIRVLRKMGMIKENDLVHEFMTYLNKKSYLIVLADIHTVEEWGHIKPCFPDNKKGSRIIVSAEQVGVASLCVGPADAAPECKRWSVDQNLFAFYEKGSQDGTYLTEAGSSSNAGTESSDSPANMKMLNRTGTMLSAYKESQLIGREAEKSKVIELITKEDRQLEVICVWGMGGLEKTTLVRDVYQHQELSGKFEKRACVTIMRPFSLANLLQDLAKQLECDVANMFGHLEAKKCLIVLDDLSLNTEWDAIIPKFPVMGTSSRIIVTTRVKDIAKHCSKKHENIYELRPLEDNIARDLFVEKRCPDAAKFRHVPLADEEKMREIFYLHNVANEHARVPPPSQVNLDAEGGSGCELDDESSPVQPRLKKLKKKLCPYSPSPTAAAKIATESSSKMALERMVEIFERRENSRNSVTSQVTVDPVRQELKEMMALVVQDGGVLGSDAHFYASQLFMKKEYRDAFSCLEEAKPEQRVDWLKRTWDERKNNN